MGIGDTVARLVGGVLQESLLDQIRLESMEDDRTFTMKDGSFMTMIQLGGALRTPGEDEIADMAERMRIMMSAYFSRPGHALEVTFCRDPGAARRFIERVVNRNKRAARNLGLDLDDVLDERQESLPRRMVAETCLIAVYTRPAILGAEEARDDIKAINERVKGLPLMTGAQMPGKSMDTAFARHVSLVDAMNGALAASGQLARVLDVHEALQEIRAGLYPDTAPMKDEWHPNLPAWATPRDGEKSVHPGKRVLSMLPETPAEMAAVDFGNLGVPTFDWQLATEDAYITSTRSFLMGGMEFAGFDMTLAPEVLSEFNALVTDITAKSADIPWRASMRIEAGGVQAQALKLMYLSIFTWAAPIHNRRLKEAIVDNAEIHGKDDTVVRFRMSFSTWAPAGQPDRLRRYSQIVMGAVKRWGNSGVDGISGDPMATVISTCPGVTVASTAPVASGPMRDILPMMPFARQASPWDTGAVMFRTSSGKPWPYQPGSSKQTTWITYFVGTPGSGKSVAMNAINFATAITPNAAGGDKAVLPRIAITDIGPSSAGVISLLQEALPANRRHEVVFQKLRMDRSNAINVFDTQLCLRQPLSRERTFLINFMTLICGDGVKPPSAAMRGLISAAIDQAYENLSDSRNARRYLRDDQPLVDRALDELGFEPNARPIWWEVVDFLMAHGRLHEAEVAQRQAVPVISDLVTASQADQVVALYGSAMDMETGQPVLASFQRMISEVVRDYPILSSYTRFSIGSARIVSLDLAGVTAVGTGSTAKKQTAIMYMLARQAMTRDFFLDEKEIESLHGEGRVPEVCYRYHRDRARENLQVPKVICMDEFHRTGGIDAITEQVILDCREGRKFNVDVKIASQLIEDFPPAMLQVATGLVVCNAGSEESISYLDRMFKLSDNEKMVMRYNLRGPGPQGAPMWVLFRTKADGDVRQELLLTLGPAELWAFSTTSEDVALRARLYETIGPKLTRRVLATRFPSGSAKSEIEVRITRLEEQGERLDDDGRGNVIGQLAEELRQQAFLLRSR
ncbi:hypothetical protein LAZ40_11580 [Cereibacter sphaeroides]|uniref:hypothetical protein n=1 Tax=Cereibacter sphaeroides TaxID=1063 RepID=UPI001F2FACEF|nr:hypothetical protein [Cereibacter sphaeroides]MCE6959659.1 hypothetical protein [Cereibacter sphaeroides]MCE6974480.1 hypothetical protein [Cereibacter sphaeroides]